MALRDGSRVLIRPVQPADKALFAESWEHFGEESRLHERGMGQIEIDVELPCDRGLAEALRAAAKGLVRLRP